MNSDTNMSVPLEQRNIEKDLGVHVDAQLNFGVEHSGGHQQVKQTIRHNQKGLSVPRCRNHDVSIYYKFINARGDYCLPFLIQGHVRGD